MNVTKDVLVINLDVIDKKTVMNVSDDIFEKNIVKLQALSREFRSHI